MGWMLAGMMYRRADGSSGPHRVHRGHRRGIRVLIHVRVVGWSYRGRGRWWRRVHSTGGCLLRFRHQQVGRVLPSGW